MSGDDSRGERDSAHCPHCGGELPEPDTDEHAAIAFCPSCGRRVEGWRTGFRASIGGANAPVTTPGGEEPTRAIAPSASLLRAAIAAETASRAKPEVATPPKKPSSPVALLGMIVGAGALVVGALLLLGKPHRPPVIVHAAPTIVPQADSPAAAVDAATRVEVMPAGGAAPEKAADEVTKESAKEAPKAPLKAPLKPLLPPPALVPSKPAAKVATGGLPHKTSKTDSRPIEQTGTSGTSTPTATTAPLVPPPSPPPLVGSSEPAQTAQQVAETRHDEAASQADAQNVRFVVQAHIAQVQACYSRAFKDSAPGGRVDIGFVIGSNGRATKVRTEQNALRAPVLSTCLEHLIEGWQFVRPSAGTLELIYPFVFAQGA